ncbi:UbiD family decarboxylase [Granulicella sp. WH15]|uniref:UbiD family decarboxylase n=1 Tax=Granulicella sp. WH15 TaxID=2602070 RepID=UPI0013A573DE|nr:UbiD family decarboxylase [Granulicella sp. WH15]
MAYRDLREYLARLEEKGLLCHVTAEVDKDWELSAVCRNAFRTISQENRPALMFDRIKGHDIPLVVGILGGSREIYATALDTDVDHVWEVWERGKTPIAPRLVESGPCQEVVLRGEDANLEILPAPIWTVGEDPGPYHSSPFIVTKDPETGVPNLGTYRVQVKGPRRAGIMINPNRHMNHHIDKNEARGNDTEVAIVFGTDPVIGLTSVSPFPYGVDELSAAGGIRGEAVDVVKCLTVDLLVPATAEIVVEGRIRCGAREAEGPFGEYAGYMGTGGNNPLFEVTCITHRRNPIYQAFLSQMPPSESSCIKSLGREMEVRRHLKNNLGLPVQDVYVTESSGAAARVIISMKKTNRFQPLKAMLGVWSLEIAVGKMVIVVDEDIDIRDSFWVEWALSFRMQPAEDIHVQRDTNPITLDPSQPLKDGKPVLPSQQVSSRVGIDATRKHPYPALAVPPKRDLDKVAAQWESYGIVPVKRD